MVKNKSKLKNKSKFKFKSAQSAIISSILLILLVIAITAIVFAFIIPFVKDKLSSGDCLDVAGKVEISSGYTCWDTGNNAMQVQIGISDVSDLIDGFSIELGGASTNAYAIKNAIPTAGVGMCGVTPAGDLELPENNGKRTYVISTTTKPSVIRVYPTLKDGRICDVSDTVTFIDECFAQTC